VSFDANRLFELLPAIHRLRDGQVQHPGALRALIDVIAEQIAVLHEDLAQAYDDQFIETCAEWVAPYIGDLIGYRSLHAVAPRIGSPRAEVANTIAYRRRKGTASMLEQLARDVSGWDARAVEFFQQLATTQYMNHLARRSIVAFDVRHAAGRPAVATPFDAAAHVFEARRIAPRRGRWNIPNVGIWLWRIADYPLEGSPAVKLLPADPGDRRYLFSPLGANAPLFNAAEAEDTITHIATRANVPQPITRRELHDDLEAYYPGSIAVSCGGVALPVTAVAASDLSDLPGGAWAYADSDTVLIDPVLGRLVLPASLVVDGHSVAMSEPVVTFHYGFPADMGGGEYGRDTTFFRDASAPGGLEPVVEVSDAAGLAAALTPPVGTCAVEVTGNGRHAVALTLTPADGALVEVRAADGVRPTLVLGQDLVIDGGRDAEVTLNGFLLIGGAVSVKATSALRRLRLVHCTLVPGLTLATDRTPQSPDAPSITIDAPGVTLEIDHSIVGGLRVHQDAVARISDSIVDATDQTRVAYAAPDGASAGGELSVVAGTVIGKVHARILRLVSNSILAARLGAGDAWRFPVQAERRQEGCVRFSYVPPGSRTPRRHACQPASVADATRVQPMFTSSRYGHPAYCQLALRGVPELRTGSDDDSEMGAYHGLYAPQRETNVTVRLEEYLRFGLEAGILYAS
jgi:hypothetical protein